MSCHMSAYFSSSECFLDIVSEDYCQYLLVSKILGEI